MSNSLWHENSKFKYSEELKLRSNIHKHNTLHGTSMINALLHFKKTWKIININNIFKYMSAAANLFSFYC